MSNHRANLFGNISLGAIALFTACILLLHVLKPELNPISSTTSEYANGSFGWIMTLAFLAMSIATASIIVALARGAPSSRAVKIGQVILAVWVVSPVVAAIFPIDPMGAEVSTAGRVHSANGGIGFFCATVGTVSVALALSRAQGWADRKGALRVLAGLIAVGWIAGAITIPSGSPIAGLVQRVLLVFLVSWYFIIASGLKKYPAIK